MACAICKCVLPFSCVNDVANCCFFRRVMTLFKDMFSKNRTSYPYMDAGTCKLSQIIIISESAIQMYVWLYHSFISHLQCCYHGIHNLLPKMTTHYIFISVASVIPRKSKVILLFSYNVCQQHYLQLFKTRLKMLQMD